MLIEAGITLRTPSEADRDFRSNTTSIEDVDTIKTRSVWNQAGYGVDRGGDHPENTLRVSRIHIIFFHSIFILQNFLTFEVLILEL